MSETPSPSAAPTRYPAPTSGAGPQGPSAGGLPSWPWLLAVVALLIITAILATMVVMRAASASPVAGRQTAPATSAAPTANDGQANDGQAEGPFDPDVAGRIADVINSRDATGFAKDGLFHDPVKVIILGFEDQMMSPDDAANAIKFMFESADTSPWDLHVSNAMRVELRHHYPAYFPESAIVAESHNSLFSFLGHGSVITTVIAIADEDDL